MLYCALCQKMVDFNSVAVSGPTRAYTLDTDGPIDPTIIHSSSKIVNVCKNCGSKDLHASKKASQANQQKLAKASSKESMGMSLRSLKLLVAGWGRLVHFIVVDKVDFVSSSDTAGVVKLTSACGGVGRAAPRWASARTRWPRSSCPLTLR